MTDLLKRLTLVQIVGLKSAVGQTLNGSLGIVTDEAVIAKDTKVKRCRYQVLIFADKACKRLPVSQHIQKMIKKENLHVLADVRAKAPALMMLTDILQEAKIKTQKDWEQFSLEKWELQAFWCEVFHEHWPMDPEPSVLMLYMASMMELANRPKLIAEAGNSAEQEQKRKEMKLKAMELVNFLEGLVKPDDPQYYKFIHSSCMTYIKCASDEDDKHLEKALELALRVPLNARVDGRDLAHDCLDQLSIACLKLCQEDVHPCKRPNVRSVYLQACQYTYFRNPMDYLQAANLANAHDFMHDATVFMEEDYSTTIVLNGRYYHIRQAVKLRRQAIATYQELMLDSINTLEELRSLLCISQLKLPGMPAADFKVLKRQMRDNGEYLLCLHKDDLHKGYLEKARDPNTGKLTEVFHVQNYEGSAVTLHYISIPTDPYHPEQWPPKLFDILSTLEDN